MKECGYISLEKRISIDNYEWIGVLELEDQVGMGKEKMDHRENTGKDS